MLRDTKLDNYETAIFDAHGPVAKITQIPLIATESCWRRRPDLPSLPNGRQARISLSRWRSANENQLVEVASDDVDDFHTLTIPLRPTRMEFTIGEKLSFRGNRQSGMIFLTGPKTRKWSAVFFKGFDHLRCYIPQSVMAECYECTNGRAPSSEIALLETGDSVDDILAHLARALCAYESYSDIYGPSFVDSFGLLIASRLLSLYQGRGPAPVSRHCAPLVKRRLDKVLDYIEAHLSKPIYLGELAEIVGLSRMHFAAQFHAATGYPPYAYVLRQRIFRAQEMLRDPNYSIADIALRVGFSNQAHFTDAFKRIIGESPGRWRNTLSR